MAISLEQATDSLIRTGLVEDWEVEKACHEVQKQQGTIDSPLLLKYFREHDRITDFQALKVSQGESAELLLGNYIVLSKIGTGGMGAVYKALHRRMNRVVAIKIIRKGLATRDFIARFRREIQAAARLNHHNVIAAYDADECELGDFLVMEYVEGTDFQEIVQRSGTLPLDEALNVLSQAAQALSYAHGQSVIHRDIKPANLMRDVKNVVKLADLGLAVVMQPSVDTKYDGGITEVGTVAGTVDYMPPEQAQDLTKVDHRADLYSLGCTFFYLLLGGPPFPGGSMLDRMLKHREAPPPLLCDLLPELPPSVDQLFQKMVAKKPRDRFQTADELLGAIEVVSRESQGPVATQSPQESWAGAEITVLIIEKSRLQVAMVTKVLNQLEIDDVHTATSGADAMEKLASIPIQLVLISGQLEDMSGLALAEKIRDELRWSQTSLILMTSDAVSESTTERIKQIGALESLEKPFDAAKLRSVVDCVFSSESQVSGELVALGTRRVLIVDDSSVARRRIQQTLTDLGFLHFESVEDGQAAVDTLRERDFDLVVTDYNMPRMNGRELIAWIRNESTQREVPIIMVTTEYDPEKLAPVYQLGVSAISGKSFEIEMVRNIMIRIFL